MISSIGPSLAAFHSVAGAAERAPDGRGASASADRFQLSEEAQQEVARLRERDREVRTHEQAHARAGGPYAGAPSYEYQRGPDGRLYAVSGEVAIDAAPIPGNPAATIAKMEIVIRAALAPAEPSSQDSRVAAEARAAKAEAQADLREQRQQQLGEGDTTRIGRADEYGRAADAYRNAEQLAHVAAETAFAAAA